MTARTGCPLLLAAFVSLASFECGTNLTSPGSATLGPPQNIMGLSVDSSTVSLRWSPPAGATDSTLKGYVVVWPAGSDTLGSTIQAVTITALPQGVTAFRLYSLVVSGELSDSAVFRWAPAARFDTPFVLTEYYDPDPSRIAGFDAGSQTLDPSTMVVVVDTVIQARMDFYLFGQGGQPLEFRSANLFLAYWNITLFSTVTTAAGSLNTYLPSFPDPTTFILGSVVLADSTIYYARVEGDAPGTFNYARIFVRLIPGTYPSRSIEVEVSLQRVPNLPYAAVMEPPRESFPLAVMAALFR